MREAYNLLMNKLVLALVLALAAGFGQTTAAQDRPASPATGEVAAAATKFLEPEAERQIGEDPMTAQEALRRAQAAGKLAKGKFLYESVLTDDKVKFGSDTKDLSPEAQKELDIFAAGLSRESKNIYIEIQGHTDSVGSEKLNEELGLLRAESVRRYLNEKHGIPLHRMNVMSYGESAAVADNSTREGRSQNRRITLVVLQ